ncbi:MAG: sulfurtransferase [Clostridia bacterium]|nr:sulfurtransferase [Clostridia bacterium]
MQRKVNRFALLLVCFLMAFAASACSQNTAPATADSNEVAEVAFDLSAYENSDFLITPQDLQGLLGSEDLVLLDCNKPDIYADEHIPGAIGIGLHAFSDKVGKPGDPGWGTIKKKEDLIPVLESLGIDNEKTVVFYSDVFRGPGADGRAVWQLKLAGMDNVKILVGGLSYWKELGYDVTKDESAAPIPTTGVELKDYDQSYMATKDSIFENLGDQVVIDVRTEGEFKGSQKAGEPRGGHIAGAEYMLWTSLLNENGTPKNPEEIKTMMAALNVTPETDFTVY